MRDRLSKMSTSESPQAEAEVKVETLKVLGDLLFAVRTLTALHENLRDRVDALEDNAPLIEVEPTTYGRAVVQSTIYEIEEDSDGATVRIHPADSTEFLTYSSETVAGAIANLLDDLGDDGIDFLLGLALAADDVAVQGAAEKVNS